MPLMLSDLAISDREQLAGGHLSPFGTWHFGVVTACEPFGLGRRTDTKRQRPVSV